MPRLLSDAQAVRFAAIRLGRLKVIRMELDDLPGHFGYWDGFLRQAIDTLEQGVIYRTRLLAEQEKLPRKQPPGRAEGSR